MRQRAVRLPTGWYPGKRLRRAVGPWSRRLHSGRRILRIDVRPGTDVQSWHRLDRRDRDLGGDRLVEVRRVARPRGPPERGEQVLLGHQLTKRFRGGLTGARCALRRRRSRAPTPGRRRGDVPVGLQSGLHELPGLFVGFAAPARGAPGGRPGGYPAGAAAGAGAWQAPGAPAPCAPATLQRPGATGGRPAGTVSGRMRRLMRFPRRLRTSLSSCYREGRRGPGRPGHGLPASRWRPTRW